MARDPYAEMAARINAVPPGMCIQISRREITDLPGLPDWAAFANITVGFDRVLESVIGSATPEWSIEKNPFTGDVTCCRRPVSHREGR